MQVSYWSQIVKLLIAWLPPNKSANAFQVILARLFIRPMLLLDIVYV